ncbi:interferon-related developmental regulator 2-like [Oppia nitens]|uniref:interferon-related developmental regulator 2-like n=1 Tax=Oppia nitens TaxID=1686743 RepID=UPI0023DBFCEB|nr:interferon-related developmental regulator 2-like [Oppia nitens]
MPKNSNSRRNKKGSNVVTNRREDLRSVLSDDNDSAIADNMSVISLTSSAKWDNGSDDFNNPTDDINDDTNNMSYIDDFESKLIEAIDQTSGKSAKTRQLSLDSIRKALTTRFCYDFLIDRKVTIGDVLEHSVKRKGEELGSAALLSSVVLITLGSSTESDAMFVEIESHLIAAMTDASVSPVIRSKCAIALGLGHFITNNGLDSVDSVMDLFQSIFGASFFKGNGAVPTHTNEISSLHASALYSWTLLLTLYTPSAAIHMAERLAKRISELLDSPDVDLRIAAGECIAVLNEISRECDEDFEFDEMDLLCDKLRALATDSQKFRAKKDRRQQRSSFRDILKAVEERESPNMMIKFGRERLVIDSWCRKRQYDALCYVLKSGMNLHLAENDLLRDIFELGAPLSALDINSKLTKFERNMSNIASCKARTKTRGKLRDKRADVMA